MADATVTANTATFRRRSCDQHEIGDDQRTVLMAMMTMKMASS
jgi:hypothetical protein